MQKLINRNRNIILKVVLDDKKVTLLKNYLTKVISKEFINCDYEFGNLIVTITTTKIIFSTKNVNKDVSFRIFIDHKIMINKLNEDHVFNFFFNIDNFCREIDFKKGEEDKLIFSVIDEDNGVKLGIIFKDVLREYVKYDLSLFNLDENTRVEYMGKIQESRWAFKLTEASSKYLKNGMNYILKSGKDANIEFSIKPNENKIIFEFIQDNKGPKHFINTFKMDYEAEFEVNINPIQYDWLNFCKFFQFVQNTDNLNYILKMDNSLILNKIEDEVELEVTLPEIEF